MAEIIDKPALFLLDPLNSLLEMGSGCFGGQFSSQVASNETLKLLPPFTQRVGKRNRLAKINVNRSKSFTQVFPGSEESKRALFRFLAPFEFPHHSPLFDQPFIGQCDGDKKKILLGALKEGI